MSEKVVLTYGTFDLFHIGHVRLLKRLRAMGDKLIVGCSSDEFNARKGKQTIIPFDQRAEVLMGCRYVDDVFPEHTWEQKRADILRTNAAVFAMGDDWAGRFDDLQDITQVLYLPRTDNISSTNVKSTLSLQINNELNAALNELRQVENRLLGLTTR